MTMLAPVLTPHGLLTLRQTTETLALEAEQGSRLEQAFVRGCGHGLLCLGADEVGTALPPVLSYWRELGSRYVTALCALPDVGEGAKPPVQIPAVGELDTMAAAVPPMTGAWGRMAMRELPAGATLGTILGVIGIARITLWQGLEFHDYGAHWTPLPQRLTPR